MMNLNRLAREIARREKGKKQVSIAQIKEIVRIIGDIEDEGHNVFSRILNAAKRRRKRRE